MTHHEGHADLPADFSGRVRLFPLPNLVVFPHAIQPLHIFEPRYVEMLEDALREDQLLAMALLKPGWESCYEERPEVYPATCVGRILAEAQLADGTYNLVLQGLCRAAIEHELPAEHAYRMADVTVINEQPPASEAQQDRLRQALTQRFRRQVPESLVSQEHFSLMYGADVPVGVLTDVIAFTLDLATPLKQDLLSEPSTTERARKLIRILDRVAELRADKDVAGPPFPPKFSDN